MNLRVSTARKTPRFPQILMVSGLALAIVIAGTIYASANPNFWKVSLPDTDFSKSSVDFGSIISGDLVLSWEKGQNSALDMQVISEGRDIGNVVVQRKTFQGMKDDDVRLRVPRLRERRHAAPVGA